MNSKIHKKPVPRNCTVVSTNQKLHPIAPSGYEKYDHCFNFP